MAESNNNRNHGFRDELGEEARKSFLASENREITLERFLEIEARENQRQQMLASGATNKYVPTLRQGTSPCGNGDFEVELNQVEWQGAFGTLTGSNPIFPFLTEGFSSGPIFSASARQTWVENAQTPLDPNVGILTTGPQPGGGNAPSDGAVRLGNNQAWKGTELLSKTFVVTQSNALIGFWYAVVFEDPIDPHGPDDKPSLWVRITDNSTGALLPGVVNLGNGSDKLSADASNPFFKVLPRLGLDPFVYKDWTCAQINLSQHIGKVVTVEFVNEDCTWGAHFGYSYIDNFCGDCAGSPEGSLSYEASMSTRCGRGRICFSYSLPQTKVDEELLTGNLVITLAIYQNGTLLSTILSPTLTAGNLHCFDFNPTAVPGINTTLGGFDFVATGAFSFNGHALAPMVVGVAPTGVTEGSNNDYRIACRWCCPGPNLIDNGDFEGGNVGFSSQYSFIGSNALGSTLPGSYSIATHAQAATISPLWLVDDHFWCNGGLETHVMVINGRTCQVGSSLIWSTNIVVIEGKDYRFCMQAKNLPQAAFDVKPQLEVRILALPANTLIPSNIPVTVVNAGGNSCDWQLITGSVSVPWGVTSIKIELWLDETGLGDGNDVAIDDLSLHLKAEIALDLLDVDLQIHNVGSGTYQVEAMPPPNFPPYFGYFWEVAELGTSTSQIVQNPAAWWRPFPCWFWGYDPNQPTVAPPVNAPAPGEFLFYKTYVVRFGAWADCVGWGERSWTVYVDPGHKQVQTLRPDRSTGSVAVPFPLRGRAAQAAIVQGRVPTL